MACGGVHGVEEGVVMDVQVAVADGAYVAGL